MADRRAERRLTTRETAGSGLGDSGRVVRFRSQDGLGLAARVFDAGPTNRLPLLCLPGLSRNSRDFIRLGEHFSRHPTEPRAVFALDYRGRGLSDPDPDWRNYAPATEARDVLAAAAAFGLERAIVVGTSRGGIIAMLLGSLRPALLAGVVLNDIGPVIEGTGLARIKTYLTARRPLRDWDEAVAAIRQAIGAHFPSVSGEDWLAYAEGSFVATPRGLLPSFDPNLTKTLEQVDFSEKIPALWPQFDSLARVPVLGMRGELSDLLGPATFAEMAKRHPRFEQLTVAGQGHAPLLRDPISLERTASFASRCDEPE